MTSSALPSSDDTALWDEIADFGAASSDAALFHLMNHLCQRIGACNALCVGALRLPTSANDDPLRGWRVGFRTGLRPLPTLDSQVQNIVNHVSAGAGDSTALPLIAEAGTWRCHRLADLMPTQWFESGYFHDFYLAGGLGDAIWAGCPVNADAELYLGVFRATGETRFSENDRDSIAATLRSLKWFFRQVLLSHGLCLAEAPLTATERAVLMGLLAGQSEKQIALANAQSPHTTHDHIKAIYRKFGVTNRAALMAIWLGKLPR